MPEKKKILFLITKSNFGGAQRYVFDLATSLPKKDWRVTVAFGGNGPLKTRLVAEGIDTEEIKNLNRDVSIINDLKSFFEIFALLRKLKPDVIHLNSSKITTMGAVAARLVGIKKIISTAHQFAFNEDRSFTQKMTMKVLYYISILLCKKTICVSDRTASGFRDFPYIKDKMIVIKNGISKFHLKSRADSIEMLGVLNKKLGEAFKDKKNIFIGTLSELHKNKGLDFMIEAIGEINKELPFVKFIIAGAGEEEGNLKKLVADKNLNDTVFFLGYVPSARENLPAFDIFSLTSRTEALPYAVLEAGYAELPVIASSVGGISEIIDTLVSGILVRPGNIREIVSAIKYLTSKKEARKTLGKNLKARILKDFSAENLVEETIKVYNS